MEGTVTWDPARSLWNGGMLLAAIVLGASIYFTWGAFAVFLVLLELTMCTGHSVGFHRRLIHRTFQCPKWLERMLVWSGTLVGMQGPFWVIQSHDFRDWAQRQPNCHPFLQSRPGHAQGRLWNLHCRLETRSPAGIRSGAGNRRRSLLSIPAAQLDVAAAADRRWCSMLLGGIPWVVWGVCVRVTAGVSMHWFVGYICHTHGPQSWLVDTGAVQAHNVPWAAIPSMGESWHNNHHAFPGFGASRVVSGAARYRISVHLRLARIGLASQIQTPQVLPPRQGITPVAADATSILR